MGKKEVFIKLVFNQLNKYLLFVSDPAAQRENFKLFNEAFKLINRSDIKILTPFLINHSDLMLYYNLADVMVFTSTAEGSPNVIKEAMACNCPIVSTDVGDVKWVFGNTGGCFITTFDPQDVAEKIKLALLFSEKFGRTNGSERIIELSLDSETVAKKIIDIYEQVLKS